MNVKKSILIFVFLFSTAVLLRSQVIVTIAGNKALGAGYSGNGGLATSAQLSNPGCAIADASGNIYIADDGNHVIRKVDPSGIITTIAGIGVGGFSGDGGLATAAKLNHPNDIAFDASGNMYIADELNNRIRKVDVNGIITTVAGTGTASYSGNGGLATAATLDHPFRVLIDNSGDLIIADSYNYAIRKVNTSGIISTIAGTHTSGFSGDGGLATSANITEPTGLSMDASGNIYFSDEYNERVRKINTSGIISTVIGNGGAGYAGDGGAATSATLNNPLGVWCDASGNLYVPDRNNGVIRYCDAATGIISTIVGNGTSGYSGDGGNPLSAQLNSPVTMSLDGNGHLYIVDNLNQVIRKLCTPADLSITGVTSLCSPNNGTVLTASGASTYTWSANAGSVTTSTVSLTPAVGNTTYSVSTYDNACPISKSITVTVTTTPTVNISGNTNICSGNNTMLTGSGATSYTWNTGFVSVNSSTISVTPSSSATFTLTGANGNCTDTQVVTVSVTPTPTLSISGSTNICSGNGTILTGSGATNYTWSPNAGSATTSTVALSPNSNTTYTLTGANGNCIVFSSVTVSVTPTPTLNISGITNICSGQSTVLSGATATSYTWSNNAGSVNTSTVSITPGATDTYTLSGSNGNCTSSTQIAVQVTPTPTISVSGNTSVCQGQGTSLTGSGAGSYTWVTSSNGNTTTTTSTNSVTTINILSPSSVTYTLSGANGACLSNTIITTVTVNPLPTVTLDTLGFSDTLCHDAGPQVLTGGAPVGGVYFGAGVSSGNFYPVVGPGTFTVNYTYTDANGCSNQASHLVIVNTCGLSINAVASEQIKVYPNPSSGDLQVSVDPVFVNGALEIIDITGRILLEEKIVNEQTQLNIADVAKGVYFVQISNNGIVIRQKLVKQ